MDGTRPEEFGLLGGESVGQEGLGVRAPSPAGLWKMGLSSPAGGGLAGGCPGGWAPLWVGIAIWISRS